jgi:LCP family protein required for cell wall assembly
MARARRTRQPRSRAQTTFAIIVTALFLVVAAGVGYVFFRYVYDFLIGSGPAPIFAVNSGGDETDSPAVTVWETWQGAERVNVLLLGVDERQNEEGPWRTDTIIVLTIDPLNRTAGMLSIPRDLWVPIPGYDQGRINTAHVLGDAYNHPGGGPGLAMETVQHNLGVPINYYIRLNFGTFVSLVDMIGGIDIDVPEEIDDPEFPSSNPDDPHGFEHLRIPAGLMHMDGELALKYARTRHSSGGDFDRAARQQQVLRAILDKVTSEEMLPTLVSHAPQMWDTLRDSFETNLTLLEIIGLADLATKIPSQNIESAVINEECTMFWETPDGQQVLVPLRDCMREIRDDIFTSDPVTLAEEDTTTRLMEEAATVAVLNGSGTPGLADATASYLLEHGIQNISTGNADRFDYAESFVYVYTGKNFTGETIAGLLGLQPSSVIEISDTPAEQDIVVILGTDFQPPQ